MKKSILIFSFLIIVHCTLYINNCSCQWEQCNGFYGGQVLSLTACGSNIFAGKWDGGVSLSTNHGISWTQTTLGNQRVPALA